MFKNVTSPNDCVCNHSKHTWAFAKESGTDRMRLHALLLSQCGIIRSVKCSCNGLIEPSVFGL